MDAKTKIEEMLERSKHIINAGAKRRRTCGTCYWCCKEEGTPYYCLMRDLYYFVEEDKRACGEWEER